MTSGPERNNIILFPSSRRITDQLLEKPKPLTKAQREALALVNAETSERLNSLDILITVLVQKRTAVLKHAKAAKQQILNNP